MRCAQKLQFFSIFWTKSLKIEEIQRFHAKSWQICGHMSASVEIHMCTKIAIFFNFWAHYNRNSIVNGCFHGRYAHIAPKRFVQKIAKNCKKLAFF